LIEYSPAKTAMLTKSSTMNLLLAQNSISLLITVTFQLTFYL